MSATRRSALQAGVVLLGLLVSPAVACGPKAPPPVLPTREVEIRGVKLTVEVADTPELRQQGLMEREGLRKDHGMLFVYSDERLRSFWMKNTPLPLSIAFVDGLGFIVSVADMQPFDETSVPSGKRAMYAIEVEQGWFDKKGIEVGHKVTNLPPAASR